MDDLLKQMGNRIYSRRKQLRMMQEELAEKAGITSQTVSGAELGKKALRPENIIRILRLWKSVPIIYCSARLPAMIGPICRKGYPLFLLPSTGI